jgi:hypothetical protein
MEDVRSTIDYEETASRFGVIGRLLQEFSEQDQLHRLVDVLAAGDSGGFHELIDSVPDFLGRCQTVCAVVREVIDSAFVVEVSKVERCALRLDLSPAERQLALQIALRHVDEFGPPFEVRISDTQLKAQVIQIIPPGAYLDELKANGLVFCWIETETVASPGYQMGLPSWQCVDVCL